MKPRQRASVRSGGRGEREVAPGERQKGALEPALTGGAEGWAERRVERGHWRGEGGGALVGALSFSPSIDSRSSPSPRPRGRAHGRAFGGLSNCLLRPLPRPAAVTARFPPARRAVRRRAREGRGSRRRRYATQPNEPIGRFISGWRGRHFVRVGINARWGPPSRLVAAQASVPCGCSAAALRLPPDPRGPSLPSA